MTTTSPEGRALRPNGRSGADRGARAVGAVVGSAVGDALGAPFESGPPGACGARFPDGAGAMCGGGGWDLAAAKHFRINSRAAGNGSPMRATESAVGAARAGRTATVDAACRIAALTHGDPAAREGPVVFHRPGARGAGGRRPAPPGGRGTGVGARRPPDPLGGGPAVAVGGDTDTVAAVTGGPAGAVYGIEAVTERWTRPLHVPLPGYGGRVLRLADLASPAGRLDGIAGIGHQKNYT